MKNKFITVFLISIFSLSLLTLTEAEEFNFDTQTLYPDGGTSVTLFGNSLFSELECLSPEKKLDIGESICYDLHWSLLKVKDKKEVYSILQNLKVR